MYDSHVIPKKHTGALMKRRALKGEGHEGCQVEGGGVRRWRRPTVEVRAFSFPTRSVAALRGQDSLPRSFLSFATNGGLYFEYVVFFRHLIFLSLAKLIELCLG